MARLDFKKPRITYFFPEGSDMMACRIYHEGQYRNCDVFKISPEGWDSFRQKFPRENRHSISFELLKSHIEELAAKLCKSEEKRIPTLLIKELRSILPDNTVHDLEAYAFENSAYFKGENLSLYEKAFRELTGLDEGGYDLEVQYTEVIFYADDREYSLKTDRIVRKMLTRSYEKDDPDYFFNTTAEYWDEVMTDPGVPMEELYPEIIKAWNRMPKKKSDNPEVLLDYLERLPELDHPISVAECYGLTGNIILGYMHCYRPEACIDEYLSLWISDSFVKAFVYHNVTYILEEIL